MLHVLVAIRDFLIAAALAWVGVTLEARDAAREHTPAPACSGDACHGEAGRAR
jgi:hypothetical protein